MKLLVIGNCQAKAAGDILEAGNVHQVTYLPLGARDTDDMTADYVRPFDCILAQDARPGFTNLWSAVATHPRVIRIPVLLFAGLTPDHTALQVVPGAPVAPIDNMSRIISAAWKRGMTQEAIHSLFNPDFIGEMGYVKDYPFQRKIMIETLAKYTPRAEWLFDSWFDRGVFFYTFNHPKFFVIEDMLREILANQEIVLPKRMVSDFLPDPLAIHAIHPNMNHPKATNHLDRPDQVYKRGSRLFSLEDMIGITFKQLNDGGEHLAFAPRELDLFDTAYKAWSGRAPEPMRNPYAGRPDWAFWSRAVARPAPTEVSPGDGLRAVIAPKTRVATAGSCFAQHVARAMVSNGLTYYVAETAPETMNAETAEARGYGLFSARYGNIYSTRQLLQLIRRAYGRFTPVETAWPVEGGFVDPFRPNIGETFASVAAVEAARGEHLGHVRSMFETLDVFVFTLGLTEGWLDRRDGAAYPVTPGAVTKAADPVHYEFANHDYPSVKADLIAFLSDLFTVNPAAQVILTVSPVPLIATYGADDVLSATTYSKSVLRAVAGDVAAQFGAVQYFPSYEIITGGFNRGAYFAEDLRSVRAEGVAHVMRVFRERLVRDAKPQPVVVALETQPADQGNRAEIAEEIARQMQVVCDEELLVRKS